jgi:hypothetical protein
VTCSPHCLYCYAFLILAKSELHFGDFSMLLFLVSIIGCFFMCIHFPLLGRVQCGSVDFSLCYLIIFDWMISENLWNSHYLCSTNFDNVLVCSWRSVLEFNVTSYKLWILVLIISSSTKHSYELLMPVIVTVLFLLLGLGWSIQGTVDQAQIYYFIFSSYLYCIDFIFITYVM